MNIVVDRIDGQIAVLEVNGECIHFPVAALPEGCKEGDMLAFTKVDSSKVLAEASDRIARMRNMSAMNSGGDLDI